MLIRASLAWAALSLLLCLAPAQAGVVVLENGKVVVGEIPAELDTAEKLTVRRPVPIGKDERGEMEFLKADVRWYSREHDAPTAEYWEKFENEKIADEFVAGREKWRLQKQQEAELKALSPSGDPSQESAEMATTPGEEKPAEPTPSPAPAPAEPAPAAPAAPADGGSGSGWCALRPHDRSGSPLGLALLALALLVVRRRV